MNPVIKELDVVRLIKPLLESPIPVGAEGTIVLVHKPGLVYEIEFSKGADGHWETLAVGDDHVEKIWELPGE